MHGHLMSLKVVTSNADEYDKSQKTREHERKQRHKSITTLSALQLHTSGRVSKVIITHTSYRQ